MSDVILRSDRRPGDDDLIVALHAAGYRDEGAHFNDAFLDHVRHTVAEADLDRADAGRVFFAERDGETLGCTAMIARGSRGQLRWVVLTPAARGLGVGRRLVEAALAYARQRGFESVYLETTSGLAASMAIYRKLGFVETDRADAAPWEGEADVIHMELAL